MLYFMWLKAFDTVNDIAAIPMFELGQLTRQQAIAMTKKEAVNKQGAYQYWLNAKVITPYIEKGLKQFKQEQAAVLAQKQLAETALKEAEHTEVYRQRDHVWQQAQIQAKRACASGYDQASRDVHLLAEAYHSKGERTAFELRFRRFVSNNKNRKALLTRLQGLSLGCDVAT
ncbi:hypothetical protein L1D44_14190 [Shewanella sp. Isolate13]|uniref:hypothetical protein n=1 Tax=Shewanella sp. Isolate13 TaxID=2908531 RepID=UPI001EFED675|nr:hypothetical protein [Shewanella sp. Isolate13]MCG9730964.1 hypothetical protein [Shewanella sp. Isolate13]